jgi:anti-sigma-K factor RskA
MRDHTEIEELFALEALGGLESGDRARVATITADHGADCAECADLRAGFTETAAMLGAALAPTPLSADLEDRTVAAALDAPEPSAASAPARRWRVASVAVAAAVVLVVVGAIGGYLAAPRSGFEAFVDQPGVQLIPFEPSDGGSGTMTLAVSADGSTGYVIGSGLQAPPAGQVYELWTIAGKTPTSLGCLVPTDGVVNQQLTGSFGTADVAAMTVEPSACPAAPSTPPVQVATL